MSLAPRTAMRGCSVQRRWPDAGQGSMRGFTILEIMIATAILTLGLVGILALFPVAIHYGKQIVERSTASVIAESVAEAIRQGMRNNRRSKLIGSNTYQYFVFKHDGITDPIPALADKESPGADYYILLPRFGRDREGVFSSPEAAQQVAKTFVYPETDANPNGGGNPAHADDDGNDFQRRATTGEVFDEVFVDKTYQLGTFLPKDDPSLSGENVLDDQKIETLKQYSYAFEVQASLGDANLDWEGKRFQPGNRLYRVRVMIYRAFPKPPGGERKVVLAEPILPVFELDFEVGI